MRYVICLVCSTASLICLVTLFLLSCVTLCKVMTLLLTIRTKNYNTSELLAKDSVFTLHPFSCKEEQIKSCSTKLPWHLKRSRKRSKESKLPNALRTTVCSLKADLEPNTAFLTQANLPLKANESLHKLKRKIQCLLQGA